MAKIAFVFPGQGAQYIGMGRDLAENYSVAQRVFEEANDVLDFDLLQTIWEGTSDQLQQTEVTQPAILATSIACLAVLQEQGLQADVVAGLSLGEYAALVAAGSLKFSEAVPLVQQRGRFMQEAVPAGQGTMAAIIGMTDGEIFLVCQQAAQGQVVEPANFNCPGQVVIAGDVAAVERASRLALEQGARKAVVLPVSAPFHSSLLQPAGINLGKVLHKITVRDPLIPIISNTTAKVVQGAEEVRTNLVAQVSSPVLWTDSVRNMLKMGVDIFVEVGPGRSLSGFIGKIERQATRCQVEDTASLQKALQTLGKAGVYHVAG